jgi:hypothetical protein
VTVTARTFFSHVGYFGGAGFGGGDFVGLLDGEAGALVVVLVVVAVVAGVFACVPATVDSADPPDRVAVVPAARADPGPLGVPAAVGSDPLAGDRTPNDHQTVARTATTTASTATRRRQ